MKSKQNTNSKKKMSFDFNAFCQQYLNQVNQTSFPSNEGQPSVPLNDVSLQTSYKCIQGTTCRNPDCIHVHPGECGYIRTQYKLFQKKCRYETNVTACRKKCGSKDGSYCPYRHCDHSSFPHLAITCTQFDCQAHCPSCI